MRLVLEIGNTENAKPTQDDLYRYADIFKALIVSGGLDGVKGGQTILHFDAEGNFMGVQLSYWPWKRRMLQTPKK